MNETISNLHTCDSTTSSRKIPFIKPVCRSTVPVDQTTVLENFRKYYENPIKSVPISLFRHMQVLLMPINYQSAAYACGVGGDYGYCYQLIQSDCVIRDTSLKLLVATYDIENLHFDIGRFGNDQRPEVARCYRSIKLVSHSVAKAPLAHANMQHIDQRSYARQSKKVIVLDCNNQSCHNNHQKTRLVHEILDDRKRQQVRFCRLLSLTIRYKWFKKTASESMSDI